MKTRTHYFSGQFPCKAVSCLSASFFLHFF